MEGVNPFEEKIRNIQRSKKETVDEPVIDSYEPYQLNLEGLVQGERYLREYQKFSKSGKLTDFLKNQNYLDDVRFEHLHENDWKTFKSSEEMERSYRAIYRSKNPNSFPSEVERNCRIEMSNFRAVQSKEAKMNTVFLIWTLWTLFWAVILVLESGFWGFIFGIFVGYVSGMLFIGLFSAVAGMGSARGRAV